MMRRSQVVWTLIYAAVIMGLSVGVAWCATGRRSSAAVVGCVMLLILLVVVIYSLMVMPQGRHGDRELR
jgi:tryptophan-rich sensory protein